MFYVVIGVGHDNDITQYTVLVSKSPTVSSTPPPEVHVSVEVDRNRFLDSPSLVRMKMLLVLM
jgi:hypothetical protein